MQNCPLNRIRSLLLDTRWNSVYTVFHMHSGLGHLRDSDDIEIVKRAKQFIITQLNYLLYSILYYVEVYISLLWIYPDVVTSWYHSSNIMCLPQCSWVMIHLLCCTVQIYGSWPIRNGIFILLEDSSYTEKSVQSL